MLNDNQRRKLDKFQRELAFMRDNAADFPELSPGRVLAGQLTENIASIERLAAQKVSGGDDFNQHQGLKEDALDTVKDIIGQINLAANAMGDEVAGIGDKFRRPRNRSKQNILATGRSFASDAAALADKFIEYGLTGTFIGDLQASIQAVEAAGDSAHSAVGARAEATGALVDEFQRTTAVSRKLGSVVKIRYRSDAGKLAAFTVASHLERTPKRAAEARTQ